MANTKKQTLRKMLLEKRSELDAELRRIMDTRVRDGVQKSPEWAKAQLVLTYLSVGDEVGTRMLIKAALEAGKTVALPRVVAGAEVPTMAWYRIDAFEEISQAGYLEKSSFGILEPPADEARLVDVPAEVVALGGEAVLALVPGLAFDQAGYRIGYGGGFYDVFLKDFGGVSLGLCRRAFYLSELPFVGENDVPVTRVVVG